MNKKAFLFDMDGTMINNMGYHLKAWEETVAALGSKLRGVELLKQLYGHNHEVFVRIFGEGHFTPERLKQLAAQKETRYRQLYIPHMQLVKGLPVFLDAAKVAGIRLAIGTASPRSNIDFLKEQLLLDRWFDVIVGADDVTHSKPHPETYLVAAEKLGVAPADCIVFEDVPMGVEAAARAGMPAVVVTTTYTEREFSGFSNIIRAIPNFAGLLPGQL